MKVGIHLRVTTDGQTVQNQARVLRKWAKAAGHQIVEVFSDEGISGAMGRSLQDLLNFLSELESVDCDLFLRQQRLHTGTPAGRTLSQMPSVSAEFERQMIRERVMAGLERAKAQGKRPGRPKSRRNRG